jgi:hypothetical protein
MSDDLESLLQAGCLLIVRKSEADQWEERLLLARRGLQCVVADPELELSAISLEDWDWVAGTPAAPRPAASVRGSPGGVWDFENGILGRIPTDAEKKDLISSGSAMLKAAVENRQACPMPCCFRGIGCAGRCGMRRGHGRPHVCEECADEAAADEEPIREGFLRGGALTLTHRLRGKVSPASIAPRSAGLAALRREVGAASASVLPAGGGGGGSILPIVMDDAKGGGGVIRVPEDPSQLVWVVADYRAKVSVGTVVALAESAVTMRGHGLTELDDHVAPVRVEQMTVAEIGEFKVRFWKEIREAAALHPVSLVESTGTSTPRAAPGEEGSQVALRIMPNYQSGGLLKLGPREIFERLKLVKPEVWPLSGPMSLLWVLEFCLAQTGALTNARVAQFMQLTRMSFSDQHMTEYSVIAKAIEFAIYHDQLMVCNLCAFELLARRFQLIEEKFKFRLPQFDSSKASMDPENDASLFLGLGTASMAGRMAVCVMPALAEFIGEELAKEASVAKGKVKAHELRLQLKKLSGKKGGGADGAGDGT